MVSGLSPETACRACIQARVVRALPWPDVGNPQRPFARQHFALRVRKSDFLVAGERASFSGDLSTPGRPQPGQARRSASGLTPKGTTFLKSFRKDVFSDPSRLSYGVEGSFFILGGRLIGFSRGVARAPWTLTLCVRLRRGREQGDPSYKQDSLFKPLTASRGLRRTGMRRRVRMIAVGIVCLLAAAVTAQVLTQHNDSARTGENLGETVLNVLNVNVNQFGKLFTEAVDGQIYAQPLYVPNVVVSGLTRNVVVVATEHNSVFAIDADATAPSTPLWQMNLGPSVPSGDIANWCRNIWAEIGVTSTPVIDPVGGTVYVVAMSKELVGASYQYFHRLHALDLATGAEKFGGPVDIQATVPGSGDGGSTVAFTPIKQLNRPGLLLSNGVVFVAFASHCDIQPYHGWVFGYAAGTLQRVAVLNTTPNGAEGGIWQSGNGLMADAGGSVYAMTGNGTFDANGGGPDYGDTVLKLATGSLTVTDWFTPGNQKTLNQQDLD